MSLEFIAGIFSAMVVALLYWLFRKKVIPFLKQRKTLKEVRLLSAVRHRNVIGLVGYCEEPEQDGAKILVYEYVPNGSLLEYIMARPVVDSTDKQSNQHIIDWARPSIEKGSVEEIIDANLLCQSEPCNMEVMLKMGKLALRCVVEEPKHRPTMTQKI
ncbi:LRR receptor-like serine/threonine-protein [Vigna angularis]|uniref:LRR receptor-like serine/threonine-protein n=1 Tax=Phaseolus angularis TaxID=3914 RepID=A0A8T0LB76_PHAAN|nr:LRR receptor-like serine/threonine-protein [Vigna angularis]